jgi:nitrite reductase/ring-hydroxylating ferredoxin subunit
MRRYITRCLISLMLLGMVALAACSDVNASEKPGNVSPSITASPVNSGSPAAPQPVNTAPKDPNRRIKATWITPVVEGDTVALPVSELEKDIIIHFAFDAGSGKMPFMAYLFEGKTFVRADICPPCRSYNFSVEKDVLICDTCGTRFKTATGDGISGACVNYPKAAVAYEVKDKNVVLKTDALKTAYQNTLNPGLP